MNINSFSSLSSFNRNAFSLNRNYPSLRRTSSCLKSTSSCLRRTSSFLRRNISLSYSRASSNSLAFFFLSSFLSFNITTTLGFVFSVFFRLLFLAFQPIGRSKFIKASGDASSSSRFIES